MAIAVIKELALSEDMEFGFNLSGRGNQFNASHLPYTVTQSVTDGLDDRYTKAAGDVRYAPILGNAAQVYQVANGTVATDAVNYQQLDLKETKVEVALKAYKNNVLELNQTTAFAPLFDYHPATKKYVDDSIYTAFQTGVTGTFTSADNKTVTVTNGLVTGIV